MELAEEIEQICQEMEGRNFPSYIDEVIFELLGEPRPQQQPPPPPSSLPLPAPPAAVAEPVANNLPRTHVEGYGWDPVLGGAPPHQNSPVTTSPQFGHQVDIRPGGFLAVPPSTSKSLQPDIEQNLQHVTSLKHENEQDDKDLPYVKMLFKNEQRAKVMADYNICDNTLIKKILDLRWKSLSKEEQARYHEAAQKAKFLHTQQHPGCSCKQNCGKYRRMKEKTSSFTEKSTASDYADVAGPSTVQTVMGQPLQSWTEMVFPLCDNSTFKLGDVSMLDFPGGTFTELISPVAASDQQVMMPMEQPEIEPSTVETGLIPSSQLEAEMVLPVCGNPVVPVNKMGRLNSQMNLSNSLIPRTFPSTSQAKLMIELLASEFYIEEMNRLQPPRSHFDTDFPVFDSSKPDFYYAFWPDTDI